MLVLKFKRNNHYVRLVKSRYGRAHYVNCFAANGAFQSVRFSSQAQALLFFHQLKKSKNINEVLNAIN